MRRLGTNTFFYNRVLMIGLMAIRTQTTFTQNALMTVDIPLVSISG